MFGTLSLLGWQGDRTMNRVKKAAFLALMCLTVLSACAGNISNDQPGPTIPPNAGNAEDTARAFLDAWSAADYKSMYDLISQQAQALAPTSFSQIYLQELDQPLNLQSKQSKSYEILPGTQRQGTTTIVHYNMTFDSPIVGKFTDSNRTMRLILDQPPGIGQPAWRVAWSRMDIFEGMAGGAELKVIDLLPTRGTIYDRNHKPIAQDNVPNYAVQFIPGNYPTGKADDCFNKLSDVFRLSIQDLRTKYGQFVTPQRTYGYVVGTFSDEDRKIYAGALEAVCGKFGYLPQTTRFYYGNGIAGQTVGFVSPIQKSEESQYPGYPQGALIGQLGIESIYQKELAGTPGAKLVIQMPDGTPLRSLQGKESGVSQDVTLTIDRGFQLAVEDAMSSAYNYANWAPFSPGAAAVVLDVKTGEVLAMASYPFYNPDAFQLTTQFDPSTIDGYNKHSATRNRVTTDPHAPGSVFKIVSMAAAADTKNFELSQVVNCVGLYPDSEIPGGRKDWIYTDKYHQDKPFHGPITLKQALTSSCDYYFWTIGEKLYNVKQADAFRKYGNLLGLGRKTGIDGVPEDEGYIPDTESKQKLTGKAWGKGDSLNSVIGQGDVQVTPLQVARMMVGVANGGKLYHPYLIKSVGTPGQTPSYVAKPPAPEDVGIDKTVLQAIQSSLCAVTQDSTLGTAQFVFSNWSDPNTPSLKQRIGVCAKTGTAQSGGQQPNGWFAAYAGRAGTPDIAVVVFTQSSREGSETSGPIARRIIEAYYGFPSYEPWPKYWTGAYDPLTDPNSSDGGGPRR